MSSCPSIFKIIGLAVTCLFYTQSSAHEAANATNQHWTRRRKFQRLEQVGEQDRFIDSRSLSTCTGLFKYQAGAVIPNVKVITIFWGGSTNVPYSSELNTFYSAITNSPWMKIISEYNTPTATFGMGSLYSTYSYANVSISGTIGDSSIQSSLTSLIKGGLVPSPDANTYYAIHFPTNVTVKSGSYLSCKQYCAYHDSFYIGSSWIAYGVMPTCSIGCGKDPIQLNNLYSVASHELAEAVTNPTGFGWNNANCGEIGDMCNHVHDTTLGSDGQRYMIQKQWSNHLYTCIGNGPTPSPVITPTSYPTISPSMTSLPTISIRPSSSPTYQPTAAPSVSLKPTKTPTSRPINKPTKAPSRRPSRKSTRKPTYRPTPRKPKRKPSRVPIRRPTRKPSMRKTSKPTPRKPTKRPSFPRPTKRPTRKPSLRPTKVVSRTVGLRDDHQENPYCALPKDQLLFPALVVQFVQLPSRPF